MISIIVPVHNAEKYISTCLDSILEGTFQNIEVIVVENASTDQSLRICKEYEQKYSCVKVITTKEKGLSHARNLGIEAAQGDYIAFADADDYVSPLLYERLYECASNYHSDFVFCDCQTGTDKNHVFSAGHGAVEERSKSEYCYNTYMRAQIIYSVVWNKLIRRDCLGNVRFDEALTYTEDRNFSIRCVCRAKKICFLNEPLYYYWRGSENSICASADMVSRMDQVYSLQKDICFFRKEYPEKREWIEYINACLLQIADFQLKKAKETKMKDLQSELQEIICGAAREVRKARHLTVKDKTKFLLEHDFPYVFRFLCRILGK